MASVGPGQHTAPLVAIPGGQFLMGSDAQEGFEADGEGPARLVALRPFLMSPTLVTNAEYAEFAEATGYRTDAEIRGSSFVFQAPLLGSPSNVLVPTWWSDVRGASWLHPEGPGSSITDRMDHPVVHVSWTDAVAFCQWRGVRLPTEAEWERAARGGLESARYPWGDELTPGGVWRCNIWQGEFPYTNSADDGFVGTSPVKAYPPNGLGLHDVAGNVWEWCADWFSADFHSRHATVQPAANPTGPPTGKRRVTRGGSFLCHDSYCNRYRVAARRGSVPTSTAANLGFRYSKDATTAEVEQ